MRAIHRLLLFNSFDAGGGFVRYIPQPMNLIKGIFNTSLGRKYIMAITGAGLFGFIIAHLLGNLLVSSYSQVTVHFNHHFWGYLRRWGMFKFNKKLARHLWPQAKQGLLYT